MVDLGLLTAMWLVDRLEASDLAALLLLTVDPGARGRTDLLVVFLPIDSSSRLLIVESARCCRRGLGEEPPRVLLIVELARSCRRRFDEPRVLPTVDNSVVRFWARGR